MRKAKQSKPPLRYPDDAIQEQPGDYAPEHDLILDGSGEIFTEPPVEPRKFYIDDGEVEVIGHLSL